MEKIISSIFLTIMALTTKNVWFRPGRLMRNARKNPGIMAVEDKYEFTAHDCSKDGTHWIYHCKYKSTPQIKCPAKAKIAIFDDKWILQHCDDNHKCDPNRVRVTAELLRHKMKCIVRREPECPVGQAIKKIRIEAAEKYSNDEDFYANLVAELGSDTALEKQMYRVRSEIVGPTPKGRHLFHPENYLENLYNDKNIVVCDSDNLSDNWRDKILKENSSSKLL